MIKKNSKEVLLKLQQLLEKNAQIEQIVQKIDQIGGKAFLVGGSVRDIFLNRYIKDLDIEVHGVTLNQLNNILAQFGSVNLVGKSFGVLKICNNVDWALARRDSSGRKPEVTFDPEMTLQDAFRRRDLTINAMGIDLITYKLEDPFDGLKDLENKVLRATDSKFFLQDPLRLFRVMQFIGRFEFIPNKELNEICKKIDISEVSRERIESEFEKLLLKSKRPSLGIIWLKEIGRLNEIFPELYALIGIKQDPALHPEGDVFEHTMQTLDEAACLENFPNSLVISETIKDEKLIFLYAALCHDLGKVTTTTYINGKIRSLGHDNHGVEPTKKFLKRITNNKDLIKAVTLLVKYHMSPLTFIQGKAKLSAYKRLANKLAPYTNLKMLSFLAMADKLGRKVDSLISADPDIYKFIENSKKAGVYEKIEAPVLHGRDFLDIVEPGPKLGELVKEAYKIQIEDDIKDKEELKKQVLKKLVELVRNFNSKL